MDDNVLCTVIIVACIAGWTTVKVAKLYFQSKTRVEAVRSGLLPNGDEKQSALTKPEDS
jgi:hypothetical protein